MRQSPQIRFDGEGLDLQIHTRNLGPAVFLMIAGAVAELSKTDVSVVTQLQPSRNQQAVDIDTSLALELEEQVYHTGIAGPAAQDPAAAR